MAQEYFGNQVAFNLFINTLEIKDKFNQYREESINKGGEIDGINHRVEWIADIAGALIYSAIKLGSTGIEIIPSNNQILNALRKLLSISVNNDFVANSNADEMRNFVREHLYQIYQQNKDIKPIADSFTNLYNQIDKYWINNSDLIHLVSCRIDENGNLVFEYDTFTDDFSDLPPILELLGISTNEDFRSPLVLDLNNDRITSLNLDESSVYFDLDNNNFKEQTAWISPNDGLLVFDRNANGKIDNGSELFGNFTPKFDGSLATDGFNALSDFDTNNDGIISNLDENFDKLQIWQDSNSNGITDDGELKSLSELGIESLNLNAKELNLIIA